MRTTLEIDEDLLALAKEVARKKGTSVGRVISEAARRSLFENRKTEVRNGVPLLNSRPAATRPDLELVNRLRDES